MLRPGQVLFHVPAPRRRPRAGRGADEIRRGRDRLRTVTAPDGSLPLLVAESRSPAACRCRSALLSAEGPGRARACCSVGCRHSTRPGAGHRQAASPETHAVEMAHGLRADVTVIDRSLPRLRALDVQFHGVVQTLFSNARDHRALRCGRRPGCWRRAGAPAPRRRNW